jgi:hypothetical protein
MNVYKKSVFVLTWIFVFNSPSQHEKIANGIYIAVKIVGEKRITSLSHRQANELLGKPLLMIKGDSLLYLQDTLIITKIEQKKLDKDSLINAFDFLRTPVFLKNSDKVYYYKLSFSKKSSLARLDIFCYDNKFFFEHEGYYYEIRKSSLSRQISSRS